MAERCRRHALTYCEECHGRLDTVEQRLELNHVEHLMRACGDSHDALMLLGTMAVVATVIKQRDEAEAALLAARREVEALRAAATDCADDLEAELRNRYHYPDVHPAMQGKYERDMESVLAVRAALAATPEEK